MSSEKPFPPQHQDRQPGVESEMHPQPRDAGRDYKAAGKLEGKAAIVTGGDSGIGRAVAVHYAMEGADVAIAYLNEHEDAERTRELVETHGRRCLLLAGDLAKEAFCRDAVSRTVEEFGRLDVVVNHAGQQFHTDPTWGVEELDAEDLEHLFAVNFHSQVYLTKAALPHLKRGASIINTTSVTAFKGSPHLLDYSATKGAIVAFTRSLSGALAKEGIRVNAVAPGPVWTPLIPASFPKEEVAKFGADYPLGRAAQPDEIAPTYVFLASDDASFYTGQVFHPNGGKIVGS